MAAVSDIRDLGTSADTAITSAASTRTAATAAAEVAAMARTTVSARATYHADDGGRNVPNNRSIPMASAATANALFHPLRPFDKDKRGESTPTMRRQSTDLLGEDSQVLTL